MKTEEFNALTKSVKELAQTRMECASAIKSMNRDVAAVGKLWRGENKPWLIRTGIALIVMPDPLVTSVVGTAFLVAGAVQEGIKRQAIYLDDLPKAFNSAMKVLKDSKDLV